MSSRNHDRIPNALVTAITPGRFFKTVIDPTTQLSTTDYNTIIPPRSVHVGDTRASFGDGLNKRQLTTDRETWIWEARVDFSVRVTGEEFEEDFKKPVSLPRNIVTFHDRQVIVTLRDAVYTHPPEQQPVHGTRATYTFEASLSPL